MRVFGVFVCSIVLLFGCSDLEKSDQLKSIATMRGSLDSLETEVKRNEIDTIAALTVATNSVELRIKNYYDSDTINLELGKKMNAYKLMRRSLSPLGRSYSTLTQGIKDQREQLTNLTSDIENGNGKRNEYNAYLLHEQTKLDQLKTVFDSYKKEKNKTMKTFHELHPYLDSFSREQAEIYNKKHPR
jgi:uncharacterized coiled-coil DUF342 family protein